MGNENKRFRVGLYQGTLAWVMALVKDGSQFKKQPVTGVECQIAGKVDTVTITTSDGTHEYVVDSNGTRFRIKT